MVMSVLGCAIIVIFVFIFANRVFYMYLFNSMNQTNKKMPSTTSYTNIITQLIKTRKKLPSKENKMKKALSYSKQLHLI